MGLDQKGNPVFRVSRGSNGQWDVCAADFDKPLASFDNQRDARNYADDIAKTKKGARVIIEDRAAP